MLRYYLNTLTAIMQCGEIECEDGESESSSRRDAGEETQLYLLSCTFLPASLRHIQLERRIGD